MTLAEITRFANNISDENIETTVTIDYANIAISKINGRLKTNLPLFTTDNSANDYTALPDGYQLSVIGYKIAELIKLNDSSLREAENFAINFEQNLRDLEQDAQNAIATEYRRTVGFGGVYALDTSTAINKTYFRQYDDEDDDILVGD